MEKLKSKIQSAFIWAAIALLILFWLPAMALVRFVEMDKVHYYTGRLFRMLGKRISRVNPRWHIDMEFDDSINDRMPYVMVSNHLSNADIPVISNLPWEMKWTAKKALFKVPVVGWMMRMSGDIRVDRKAEDRRAKTLSRASYYLKNKCSVIFFPEGTRSKTGNLTKFTSGAFELAIRTGSPVLPIVVDGTQHSLPKHSWIFDNESMIKLKVLEPISTENMSMADLPQLIDKARDSILQQLAAWRGTSPEAVDQLKIDKLPQDPELKREHFK